MSFENLNRYFMSNADVANLLVGKTVKEAIEIGKYNDTCNIVFTDGTILMIDAACGEGCGVPILDIEGLKNTPVYKNK